jgi:hypothetical protein
MEIKANNWYRTRGGEIAYVAAIVPFQTGYPALGVVQGDIQSWMLAGLCFEDDTSNDDLVEHLPDCDSFDWVPKPKVETPKEKSVGFSVGDILTIPNYETAGGYRSWEVVAVLLGGLGYEGVYELVGIDAKSSESIKVPCLLLETHPGIKVLKKPKIQLETGKKYVLANGEIVGPMATESESVTYRFYSQDANGIYRFWKIDGVRKLHDCRPTENIVSEYIEPEPTYEPFGNAAEFAPHRDKWMRRINGTNGAFTCNSYDDHGVWHGGTRYTYKELIECKFEDGTPCGKRVQP